MKRKKGIKVAWMISILVFILLPLVSVQASEKININTASAQELTELKYIGDKVAERIIQYRKEHGPFKSPGDITNVRGIGTKIFDANKERITIN
jgi:competence protein ComEA